MENLFKHRLKGEIKQIKISASGRVNTFIRAGGAEEVHKQKHRHRGGGG